VGNQKRAVSVENMPYHSLISYAFYSSPSPPKREKAPFIRALGQKNGTVTILLGIACFIGKGRKTGWAQLCRAWQILQLQYEFYMNRFSSAGPLFGYDYEESIPSVCVCVYVYVCVCVCACPMYIGSFLYCICKLIMLCVRQM
jgi:hypothetical protein